jgi:hypothetical protein
MSSATPPSADADAAGQIIELARDMVRSTRPPGRRDAHVKHHGLVHAEVHIRSDIPSELRHGLFAAPLAAEKYRAYIRFSNAAHREQSDHTRDAHGMAIKLLGVPGAKLLDDEPESFDLVLVDHPIFFVNNLRTYLRILRFVTGRAGWSEILRTLTHVGSLWRARRTLSRIASPLATTYFSMTAFKLGPHSIKWLARPIGAPFEALPAVPSDDYLRNTMARELERGARTFELCVQLRTQPELMPDDDPVVLWSTNDSRPIPVATIRIFRQRFNHRDQMAFAEAISFNPWRVTAEHAPIGRVNELRREVYAAAAALRHELSGAPAGPLSKEWNRFGSIIEE